MDPPACIQNAMMTKDKKPFTYTPGGIDLSEVRSPRMARRIERNAHLGGVEDAPRTQQNQSANYASLPPSTLAAMRPQPQVQVFPSGPPPPAPIKGGMMPPPPPPPMNMPPPPPPPSAPLPTQKVRTSDNQTLERPDMTKIIPDNPMALLRKTGGPAPRKSVVDEMFEQVGKPAPTLKSPPINNAFEREQRYQPPANDFVTQNPPVPNQQNQQPTQAQWQPQQQHSQTHPQPAYKTSQNYSPGVQSEETRYEPPVIERKTVLPKPHVESNEKVNPTHPGQLYIPPANQWQQKRVISPPSPPERSQNSPQIQTPPLREAPRPWQTKKPQQEELPPWTKKESEEDNRDDQNNSQPTSPLSAQQKQNQQSRWQQSKPVQQTPVNQQAQFYQQPQYQPQPQYDSQPHYNQQPVGVRIEIRTKPQPYNDSASEEGKPNAVYVTQPLVFQHPGPRQPSSPQQQTRQQGNDNQGARVIPVQIEGSDPRSPTTPRSLNRQQSWGNNPTQSNSFKIIQKITQTDDNDYDDTPLTQHSPRYTQNFQQPTEQIRRMKLQDCEPNRFKQGSLGSQSESRQPQVRTIPIQLEDDGPQKYVHPSEQVVQEPKKYTGSAIPSRSFKILQAMTAAPDNCANADKQYEAPLYDHWAYPPYPYPPPYWSEHYHNLYYAEPKIEEDVTEKIDGKKTPTPRVTPVPYFEYMQPYYKPKSRKAPSEECYDSSNSSRSTPLPFWNPEYYYQSETEASENSEEPNCYPYYPPYYDPYYFHYYYGYPPPMYPPMYYYRSISEDSNNYSSAEELASFHRKSNKNLISPEQERSKITSPLELKENVSAGKNPDIKNKNTIDENDMKEDPVSIPISKFPSLKSIKSVNNMKIYEINGNLDNEENIEECSDYTTEDTDEETSVYAEEEEEEEDEFPHQLSIIMEESERAESRLRSASITSNTSTLSGNTGVEEDEPDLAIITLPPRNKSKSEETVEEQKLESHKNEDFTMSFTLKNPSSTILSEEDDPKKIENEPDFAKEIDEEDDKKSDDSEDWWGILGKDEDDFPKKKSTLSKDLETDTIIKRRNDSHLTVESDEEVISENKMYDPSTTYEVKDVLEDNKKDTVYDLDDDDNDDDETYNSKSEDIELEFTEDNRRHQSIYNVDDVYECKVHELKADNLEDDKERSVYKLEQEDTFASRLEEFKLDVYDDHKKRSVYDLDDDEDGEEEITNGGKLLEMESFVEKLEQLKRNSGLWNLMKAKSRSKMNCNKEKITNIKQENLVNKTNTRTLIEKLKDKQLDPAPIIHEKSSADYRSYNYSESSQDVKMDKYIQSENKYIHSSNKIETESDVSSDSETSSSDEDESPPQNIQHSKSSGESPEKEVKLLSIQQRIAALRESINQKQNKISGQEETKNSVKEKVSAIETCNRSIQSKTTSTKSSVKSFEEYSEEEEVDSGVTSDMSRHISDNEEFPELRKLTRYQRAATHSRLFKLLQEVCESETDDGESEQIRTPLEPCRRDLLSLPLKKLSESESVFSSGKSSPNGGINEKLVHELVQSLLKRKKGQVFRDLPKEKLYAAATKVLQEEIDILETPSDYSSFLSRNGTGYSTAAQTPQEFNSIHDEYNQYYDSWNEADINSKTDFKNGLLTKGSKTISSKHIHKKIMKLLDSSNSSHPHNKPLDTNEVTTAS